VAFLRCPGPTPNIVKPVRNREGCSGEIQGAGTLGQEPGASRLLEAYDIRRQGAQGRDVVTTHARNAPMSNPGSRSTKISTQRGFRVSPGDGAMSRQFISLATRRSVRRPILSSMPVVCAVDQLAIVELQGRPRRRPRPRPSAPRSTCHGSRSDRSVRVRPCYSGSRTGWPALPPLDQWRKPSDSSSTWTSFLEPPSPTDSERSCAGPVASSAHQADFAAERRLARCRYRSRHSNQI
jgi:hypothetical protein